MASSDPSPPIIAPLRKRWPSGKPYTRVKVIEAKLQELVILPRGELATRCAITDKKDPLYVPSECLVHFVRACRAEADNPDFAQLYKLLAARILSRLPNPETAAGGIALTRSRIKEKVFDRFVARLMEDRTHGYQEKLDFWEVRFDSALLNYLRDAQRQVWREEGRSTSLELDEKTGQTPKVLDLSQDSFDPFDPIASRNVDYRLRREAAIDTLLPFQQRIIELTRNGMPIDSIDPQTDTIAKTLGKSEKTIRIHLTAAKLALKAAMTGGARP